MGAEDLRKIVDERLEYIRKELKDISEAIPEGPLQERVLNLTGEIEKLVYETLSEVPSAQDDQEKEVAGLDHRSNQASYGGVPELFMSPAEQRIHKHTVSFGGIRQLFDVEMEVFGVNKPEAEANGHESPCPSVSPTYEDVHKLFMEGPLKGDENFNGVSDMFRKEEKQRHNFGEKRKIMGKEFDPTGRNHDRNVSIGGVRQLGNDLEEEDDELFERDQNEVEGSDKETPEETTGDPHNRTMSIGGARQLVTMECDTFSDEEVKESSPQAPNNDKVSDAPDDAAPDGHGRGISVGGVRALGGDEFDEEDLNFDGEPKEPQVDLEDDQSDVAESAGRSPVAEDLKPEDTAGMHDRNVSIGGVRTLQVFDLGLDDIEVNMEGKPRELFDGKGTVEDPQGPERRRSNLQDGRELFEDQNEEKVSTFDQMGGVSYLDSNPQGDGRTKMQDLKREHLQLKMSKIELIKSTAEEIDRLRGIIKTLASQLRHINEVHNKLLNATLGGQMYDSVSGVFGAFTGFFSAPTEPSSVQRNMN